MMKHILAIALALFASAALPASFVASNNSGSDFSADCTYISEANATTNYGTNSDLSVTKFGSGQWDHSFCKFAVTAAGGEVDVSNGKLRLYLYSGPGTGTQEHSVFEVLRNLVEAEATWNIYSTGNNWTTAGATGAGDRTGAAVASNPAIPNFGTDGYVEFEGAGLDQLIEDVRNGDKSLLALMTERTDGANDSTYALYRSDDHTDGFRPELTWDETAVSSGLNRGNLMMFRR
jgi:hypothetical protein